LAVVAIRRINKFPVINTRNSSTPAASTNITTFKINHLIQAFGAASAIRLVPGISDTAAQALYQASKGILRKVNKLALTALRLAAARKSVLVNEAILLEATGEALL